MTVIEKINQATGQETLHPLICVVDNPLSLKMKDVAQDGNLYAVTIEPQDDSVVLNLYEPGKTACDGMRMGSGVYFHPDLLCDTPLEGQIADYPKRCICHGCLTQHEADVINDCLCSIKRELNHPIDRHTSVILSSYIELLLNYCVKMCN